MKRTEFLKKLGINLDMAVEAHELLRGETGQEIPGVKMDKQSLPNAEITLIEVMDPQGSQIMGKAIGKYITIDAPVIRENDKMAHREITKILAEQLGTVLNLGPNDSALIVGLGNWNATPDALGPRVVHYSMATRHLKQYGPAEVFAALRSVSAFAPGVLGITGIETAEIVKGVVDRSKPNVVIAIDALAAQNVERIGTSLQIANTGINPGSGVGNKRAGLTEEFLGVPVIAIGVPTVVNAAVIAQGVLEQFVQQMSTQASFSAADNTLANNPLMQAKMQSNPLMQNNTLVQGNPMMQDTGTNSLNPMMVEQAIKSVLQPYQNNLMVTPKEIDDLINNIGRIIADALAWSLHPSVSPEDLEQLMH